MAEIKILKDTELIGGTNNKDVYPVTSTQAIYSHDKDGNVREIEGEPEKLEDRLDDIQHQIDTIEETSVALSNNFGYNENIGISQKTLTLSRDSLQSQIDAIVNDKAVVNLTATPNPVFVGTESNIALVATTDTSATSIKIKKGVAELATGEGFSLSGSDTITPLTAGTTTYTAEFLISGIEKAATKDVVAVYPIRIGSSATYTEGTALTTPKASAVGTYNVTVTANEDYVWFNVPSTMTIHGATMGGFEFPLEAATNVTIDSIAYKSYRSSNTYDAGSLTIVIS